MNIRMDFPIYFTLQQARAMLPEVKSSLEKIMKLKKEINLLKSIKIDSNEKSIGAELALMELNQKYFKKMHIFYKELSELTKNGIVVKDVNDGLVDFYSKQGDTDILLCWKYGEPDINYWHYIDVGFAGRKSISLLEDNKSVKSN